jgi:hypothetical protein
VAKGANDATSALGGATSAIGSGVGAATNAIGSAAGAATSAITHNNAALRPVAGLGGAAGALVGGMLAGAWMTL